MLPISYPENPGNPENPGSDIFLILKILVQTDIRKKMKIFLTNIYLYVILNYTIIAKKI